MRKDYTYGTFGLFVD